MSVSACIELNYYRREDYHSINVCGCMYLQVTALHLTVVKISQPPTKIRIHLEITVDKSTEAAGG